MTTEQFNKKSCELIEKIQDLQTEALLAQCELKELREEYLKELRERGEHVKDTVSAISELMGMLSRDKKDEIDFPEKLL